MRFPVFLDRNRRKMKELRKHLHTKVEDEEMEGTIQVSNGLVMRQVPVIRKLQYDPQSEDTLVYKRKKVEVDLEKQA